MIETRSLTPSPVIPLSTLSHPANNLEDNVSSISSMVEMESVLNHSSKLPNKLPRYRLLNFHSNIVELECLLCLQSDFKANCKADRKLIRVLSQATGVAIILLME